MILKELLYSLCLMFNVKCFLYCLTVFDWKWSDYNKRHIITLLTWTRFRSVSWLQRLSVTVSCPEVSDENTSVSYITPLFLSFIAFCAMCCNWLQYVSHSLRAGFCPIWWVTLKLALLQLLIVISQKKTIMHLHNCWHIYRLYYGG